MRLRIEGEEDSEDEDHELGIEQEHNAGMVKAPPLSDAARGFAQPPARGQHREHLPARSVQILNIRKAGKKEAGRKRAQGQTYAAHQTFLPQMKKGKLHDHNQQFTPTAALRGPNLYYLR